MKKSILFISDNFPPETNAVSARVFERARYWVEWGHEVTVITCAPNFPAGKIYPGYKNRWYQVEMMDGIRVVRVKTFMARNSGFILRVLDFMSFMLMAIIASVFQKRPDVVVATSPQFFSAVAGYVISIIKWRPFIFEVSDLWPASIAAVGSLSKSSFVYRAIEQVELFLYRCAKTVVLQTEAFKQDLINRGIASNKLVVIPNAVDLRQFSPVKRDEQLAKQYHLHNRFVVGYIGTHGMAHQLSNVLSVAERLKNEPITFLFVGDGADKEKLCQIKNEKQLDNVVFIPPQKKENIAAFWGLCDVALVHLKNDPTFTTVVPSKIYEAMAMGIPILLVAPEGEAAKIIQSENVGLFVRSGDQKLFIESVLTFYRDINLRDSCREHALKVVAFYSREEQARKLLEVFK